MRLKIIRQTSNEVRAFFKLKKLRNAERVANEIIKEMERGEKYELAGVRLDESASKGDAVIFIFKLRKSGTLHYVAKQFSKEKYASCDEGIKKFYKHLPMYIRLKWEEFFRIEQEKYWLVIFRKF